MMRALSVIKWGAAALALLLLATAGLDAVDRAFPPPMGEDRLASAETSGRHGELLRAWATADGKWRMGAPVGDIDPAFKTMLLAYEDRRFYSHHGVDPLALLRAAWQLATQGRIVSGGSTITMQLARLAEPRGTRSFAAKARQALRALQIERRLTKDEILARYLALAPYGGNIEGVRAASLAWFGKEPKKLRLSEAALLVALPQAPEARRPDRHPAEAKIARDRVLQRMAEAQVIVTGEVARAALAHVPRARLDMPQLAAHLADRMMPSGASSVRLTLDGHVQAAMEAVTADAARRLGRRLSIAMVLADASAGDVLGHVGSPGFSDDKRFGWIDMTRQPRSPGSTLKPFIYGLAFEEGLAAAETLIEDRPADFGGYRPRNFDTGYRGDVTVAEALQMSLNVPAVRLLESVGPQRLAARFRNAGVTLAMPRNEPPGLAIGLGGAGVTLEDLVSLYTGLATDGRAVRLEMLYDPSRRPQKASVLPAGPAWRVTRILAGMAPPPGAAGLSIAYKTGTSYGYRDAWAVGYDGAHVLGVWVGRPDNGSVPGMTGGNSAAPILFEALARTGLAGAAFAERPDGASELARAELPSSLRRFGRTARRASGVAEAAPAIVYPPAGARVALAAGDGYQPLALKLQGGRAPFRWLANGRPLADPSRSRERLWQPDGRGAAQLTVIDAAGRAASVDLFVE